MVNDTTFLQQLSLFEDEDSYVTNKGYVYFVHSPATGLTKIGFAANLERRQSQYATHTPEALEWQFYILTSNYRYLERTLHAHFADQRTQREWFDLSERDFIWIYKHIPGCHAISGDFNEWIRKIYQEKKECHVIDPLFRKAFRREWMKLEDPFDGHQVWNLYANMLLNWDGR